MWFMKDHLGWISWVLYLCKQVQLYTFTTLLIRVMLSVYILVNLFLNIQDHTDHDMIIFSILWCVYLRVRKNHV
jgi:hypothetical protein